MDQGLESGWYVHGAVVSQTAPHPGLKDTLLLRQEVCVSCPASRLPHPGLTLFLKSSFCLLIKVIAAHYRERRKHEVTEKTVLGQHGLSHLY